MGHRSASVSTIWIALTCPKVCVGKGGAVSVSVEEPKEAKFGLIFIFGYLGFGILGIWVLDIGGFGIKKISSFCF
ncbi:hypothetical protein Csa_022513 [Cucumis sativus]|uniref:Uncharacterized protein n=1 Tax=Cucumis sativus TaxID=3659 RepID=A0A0A0LTL4_CUCSA|nr:hypothetical protein Csa_022513 [Cucumis sativus]